MLNCTYISFEVQYTHRILTQIAVHHDVSRIAVHHDVSPTQLVEMQVPRADALDSSQFSDPAFLLMQPSSQQQHTQDQSFRCSQYLHSDHNLQCLQEPLITFSHLGIRVSNFKKVEKSMD